MYRPEPKKCIHPRATAGVCVCTCGPLNHNRTMADSDSRPSELVRRQSIVLALRAGMGPAEIIRKLKLPKKTVYRVAKVFSHAENSEEGSYTGARKTHVRKQPKRSPKLVDAIRERISKDPHISQRRLATEFRVSRDTVQNVIHKDLKCKAYRPKVRQMLSEANRKARVERCGRLLQSLKTDTARCIRFFSDEKMFTVDEKFNRQNHRCTVNCAENACVVPKTKFPASVHVLGVVSSQGHVMPPYFFSRAETVTKEVYLRVLQTVMKPWMDRVSDGNPYVFQQDGAPAHTSRMVQDWLSSNVNMFWPKEFWPPNSPDLNPMDYYVWSAVELRSNKERHPNTASLTLAIKRAFRALPKHIVKKACCSFRPRLEAVVANNGGYIE